VVAEINPVSGSEGAKEDSESSAKVDTF